MKRRTKFQLIKTNCKRCGRELYTGNRSLFGLDEAKKKLGGICSECITPEERQEMRNLRPMVV